MTKEEREIIAADLWEKLKLLHEEQWETLVVDVVEELSAREAWRSGIMDSLAPRPAMWTSEIPFGVEVPLKEDSPTTYAQISPPREGYFFIEGIRSFNRPGEIWVEEISPSGIPMGVGFDSATYSLDHGAFRDAPVKRHLAYYRAPWGTISHHDPLLITFRAGTIPGHRLRWTLYGTLITPMSSMYGCAVVHPDQAPSDRCE